MSVPLPAARERRLRALDVELLRWRGRDATSSGLPAPAVVAESVETTTVPAASAAGAVVSTRITRLALQPDPAELRDPAVNRMYMALTEAVPKAGLQSVRVCDVADDPGAAVMVFGVAPLPEGVPALRVLRADPLAVLNADRERKRLLWELMQALGRGGG